MSFNVTPGSIRFNTDSMKLEYYHGGSVGLGTSTITGEWVQITTASPDVETGGASGLFGGGITPAESDTIEFINIATTGNATDFGDLTVARLAGAACSNGHGGL